MEEAREQQMELRQIQQDLIQANQELARLSDRLRAMHQVAEEARRAKAEFVANVGHELRTTLNLIVGFSEMVATAPESYGGVPLPSQYRGDVMATYRFRLKETPARAA
jgi:signal transduction histidine kinase